jgi:hypothetical protein
VDNGAVLCRAHNQWQARLDFGADLVARKVADRRAAARA